MTMRAALYARYSSDLQNERSAADQLAALRQAVQLRGWTIAAEYRDEGISGATLGARPGVQALLADGQARRFDVVMAEDLDRLSRDQEGTAHLYKRLDHAGVAIETLTQGRIGVMHVGLAGTMNQLFLENLAHKTRRGLEARVRAGFSGGGRCFGYDLAAGQTGVLTINEREAQVVREIFADYAKGQSPRAIAKALNARGVAGPRGKVWSASNIAGDRRAGDGVLCNELYIGMRAFNRRRFRKHPDTGRRSSTLNPPEAWIRQPAPQLRIVSDEAWAAVRGRQSALDGLPRIYARQPKRLLSGLLHCGRCGGRMVMTGDRFQCARRRDTGACDNTKAVRVQQVEARVLAGIQTHLLTPVAIAQAVRDFQAEQQRARLEQLAARAPNEREVADVERKISRAHQAYLDGAMDTVELASLTEPLKARRAALQAALEAAPEPAVVQLHPGAAEAYRALAENLHAALDADDAGEVRDELRKLLTRVDLHPGAGRGEYELTVHGTLAELIEAGRGQQKTPDVAAGGSSVSEMITPNWWSGGCGSPIRAVYQAPTVQFAA